MSLNIERASTKQTKKLSSQQKAVNPSLALNKLKSTFIGLTIHSLPLKLCKTEIKNFNLAAETRHFFNFFNTFFNLNLPRKEVSSAEISQAKRLKNALY